MIKILVIDDEPAIRESLSFALKRDGFHVEEASLLSELNTRWKTVDLLILDLMLPDGSGIEFLRNLRQQSDIPVIVLTSRDDETDRVVGLEVGADDYVIKPFSPREVSARVRAVLRRTLIRNNEEEKTLIVFGNIEVSLRTRRAKVGSNSLVLSRTEFDLLTVFLRSPGRVFERGQLLHAVWGPHCVVSDRTVDVHIKTLRRKLKSAGADPQLLETVRGVGYRFREQ